MNPPSSIWPQSKDDPFLQKDSTKQNSPPSSWKDEQETIPKWNLQTDEERMDQQKAIRIMESKLRRVKERQEAPNQHWMDNDSDSNDEVDDQEGLSLLWQQKYTRDEALAHQKDDGQYLPFGSSWLSWLGCCCSSPSD